VGVGGAVAPVAGSATPVVGSGARARMPLAWGVVGARQRAEAAAGGARQRAEAGAGDRLKAKDTREDKARLRGRRLTIPSSGSTARHVLPSKATTPWTGSPAVPCSS
jgi:hypothetical protein